MPRASSPRSKPCATELPANRYDEGKRRFLGSLVTGSTELDVFEGCDFVLEAVFEELAVKKQVFGELEAIVSPECIFATNTSSLSVTEMGAGLEHPGRLVGMHFFNPVAMMPLLELIRTPETDDTTLATAWALSKKLGKRGVLVEDAPGFVVNRVLTRMTRVLMDAIEHGSSVEDTDEAILRLGMPMAPSVLLQMVGPRVANHVLETLHDGVPGPLPALAGARGLRRGNEEPVIVEHAPWSIEEIQERAMDAVADEIQHMLAEGVVAEAADVDTCLLLGAGWPFFMGGATRYLDQTGVSERLFGRPFAEAGAEAGRLMASDDFRVRVTCEDAEGLLENLHLSATSAEELADELKGQRLAVTRDDDTVFVYTDTRAQAEAVLPFVEGHGDRA